MALRASSFLKALPKAPLGFGGRSSQGSNIITVFGGTGMTGASLTLLYLLFFNQTSTLFFLTLFFFFFFLLFTFTFSPTQTGKYVINELGRQGNTIFVPTRGDDMEIRHLKLMGDLGKIQVHYFDPKVKESVAEAIFENC